MGRTTNHQGPGRQRGLGKMLVIVRCPAYQGAQEISPILVHGGDLHITLRCMRSGGYSGADHWHDGPHSEYRPTRSTCKLVQCVFVIYTYLGHLMPMQFAVVPMEISIISHELFTSRAIPNGTRFQAHVDTRQRYRKISIRRPSNTGLVRSHLEMGICSTGSVRRLSSKFHQECDSRITYCSADERIRRCTCAKGLG